MDTQNETQIVVNVDYTLKRSVSSRVMTVEQARTMLLERYGVRVVNAAIRKALAGETAEFYAHNDFTLTLKLKG